MNMFLHVRTTSNTDDTSFAETLAGANAILAAPGERTANEIIELILLLEKLELFGPAILFMEQIISHIAEPRLESKFRMLKAKNEKRIREFRERYAKNIQALKTVMPGAPLLDAIEQTNILIAGGARRGFHFLAPDGAGYRDITPDRAASGERRLALERPAHAADPVNAVLVTNILFIDVYLSFLEKTERGNLDNDLVLYVADASWDAFNAVLRTTELSDVISRGRLVPFIGDDIPQQVRAWFDGRPFAPLPEVLIVDPGYEDTARAFLAANESRAAACERIAGMLDAYYGGISDSDWSNKFSASGIKALLLTTRFSTFIQYATRDMARALERLGHQAAVLIEPDKSSTLTPIVFMKTMEREKPDFVMCIDHHRYQCAGAFPPALPYAVWTIDDHLGLFEENPSLFGDRDFIFHIFERDLVKRGYDPERLYELPMPASDELFKPYKLTMEEQEAFACDLAYVGAAPDTHAIRDILNLEKDSFEARLFHHIKLIIESDPDAMHTYEDYAREIAFVEKSTGLAPPVSAMQRHDYIVKIKMYGLGSYLTRTLPLDWAASTGRTLHIYGRNWDNIPTLSPYAKGYVSNGPELSKAYQAAKIHIAVTPMLSFHPRVSECLLSGGFILVKHIPPEKDALSIYNYFDAGREIDVFRSKDEFFEKVNYYLENEGARRDMAARGRKKVLENHTYAKAMARVVETIRGRLAGEIP